MTINKKTIISIVILIVLTCIMFIAYKFVMEKQIESIVSEVIFEGKSKYLSRENINTIIDAINDNNGTIHVKKVEYNCKTMELPIM